MAGARQTDPDRSLDRILRSVAAREGVEPAELPPVYDVIDPDALEALIDGRDGDHVTVEFTYCGYEVTATSSDVHVRSPEASS